MSEIMLVSFVDDLYSALDTVVTSIQVATRILCDFKDRNKCANKISTVQGTY